MRTDVYGQQIYDEMELCLLYLQDPTRIMKKVLVNNPSKFDEVLELENKPELIKYEPFNCSVKEFDKAMQSVWLMPEKYYDFDVADMYLDDIEDVEDDFDLDDVEDVEFDLDEWEEM